MTNPSSSAIAAPSATRISWPHVVLALIGAAISGYAIYVHTLIERGEDAGCGVTDTISCDKVLASQYGEFLGIPLGAFGVLYFVVVLLTAITTNPDATPQQVAAQRLAVAALGFTVSVGLTYISLAVIGAACPVCMSTHATTFTLLLVSAWQYLKVRRQSAALTQREAA